jgi:ribonucleotide monophosphatase NagD (HAD superfamily)
VVPQLDHLAVPRKSWSVMVTSGDATRTLLAERAPGPAWAIGPERDAPLYEGLGLTFAGPERAAFISCTGPYDDEAETPEDYRDRFVAAIGRGLEMICANPDSVVQRGSALIYCGGALAEFYAALGGRALMAGKPFAPIDDLALAEAGRLLGRPLDAARVLAVGDGIATDIRGANAQGLDVLFIAGGIHSGEMIGDGGLDDAAVERALGAQAAQAGYAMAELAW